MVGMRRLLRMSRLFAGSCWTILRLLLSILVPVLLLRRRLLLTLTTLRVGRDRRSDPLLERVTAAVHDATAAGVGYVGVEVVAVSVISGVEMSSTMTDTMKTVVTLRNFVTGGTVKG